MAPLSMINIPSTSLILGVGLKKKTINYIFMIIIIICLGRIPVSIQHKSMQSAMRKFPAVFVFGDSTADPGNNNQIITIFKGNFPPYGQDFKGHKATGRFSNGKLVGDFIVSKLGIKEILPAYLDPNRTTSDLLTGVSFASAGSGYDNLSAEIAFALSLERQLELMGKGIKEMTAKVGKQKVKQIVSDALYGLSTGANDFQITYFKTPLRQFHYNVPQYIDLLLQSSLKFFKKLYKIGARKIVVLGVPPLGCLPFERTLDGGPERICNDELNSACQQFQVEYVQQINKLMEELPRLKILYFDTYSSLLDLIQNSTHYGFDKPTLGCCGTGTIETGILCNESIPTCLNVSKHVFWDSVHPTERAYEIIADELIVKIRNEYQNSELAS